MPTSLIQRYSLVTVSNLFRYVHKQPLHIYVHTLLLMYTANLNLNCCRIKIAWENRSWRGGGLKWTVSRDFGTLVFSSPSLFCPHFVEAFMIDLDFRRHLALNFKWTVWCRLHWGVGPSSGELNLSQGSWILHWGVEPYLMESNLTLGSWTLLWGAGLTLGSWALHWGVEPYTGEMNLTLWS